MTNNISALFENLMTYNEQTSVKTNKIENKKMNKKSIPSTMKKIDENNQTLLNLTVELPDNIEDITPDDVDVNVGVMLVDDENADSDKNTDAIDEEITDEETSNNDVSNEDDVDKVDVTPEDEDKSDDTDKKESFRMKREAFLRKQLESKTKCDGKECDSKKESLDEKSLDKAINKYFDSSVKSWNFIDDSKKEVKVIFKDGTENEFSVTKFEESSDVETAKANIRKRVASTKEAMQTTVKKEALCQLNTKSLNKLVTEFVKENYKNIDKIVITKAVLENQQLTLKGYIKDLTGKKESIVLVNKGFDAKKLENTRFLIDFKDASNTFNVIKENAKQPFTFVASIQNRTLKFESLNYKFKTKLNENKIALISGKCTLNESVEVKNENADQIKKFNEIVEKIKAAKTANDLIACKDEMDDSNIGDTLLSAAQMIWDDVNSKMVAK